MTRKVLIMYLLSLEMLFFCTIHLYVYLNIIFMYYYLTTANLDLNKYWLILKILVILFYSSFCSTSPIHPWSSSIFARFRNLATSIKAVQRSLVVRSVGFSRQRLVWGTGQWGQFSDVEWVSFILAVKKQGSSSGSGKVLYRVTDEVGRGIQPWSEAYFEWFGEYDFSDSSYSPQVRD